MTIKVIGKHEYPLSTKDIKDGCAYMDDEGFLYIGNRHDETVAASVCGGAVIWVDTDRKFREVSIEIRIVE